MQLIDANSDLEMGICAISCEEFESIIYYTN